MSKRVAVPLIASMFMVPVAVGIAPSQAVRSGSQAPPASASDEDAGVPSNFHVQTSEEADQSRIKETAEAAGISVAEATTIVHGQDQLGRSLYNLRTALPDNYSTAEWTKDNKAVVHLTTDSTDQAIRTATELFKGQPVEIRTDASYSKATGQRMVAELSAYILSERPDVTGLKVGRDAAGVDGLKVEASEDVSDVVAQWSAARRSQAAVPVSVRVIEGVKASSTASVVGGAQLNVAVDVSECTSAFPVYAVIGGSRKYGILSADHCANSLLYGNSAWLTFRASTVSKSYGDMQWHSTTQTVPTLFQSSPGVLTNVRYAGEPYPGLWLSRYGRNTRERIQVDTIDNCETYTNGTPATYCRLADTVYPSNVEGGDSGGPWFDGETVYAIQSGKLYVPPTSWFNRSSMSPIWDIVDCLPGVTLHRAI